MLRRPVAPEVRLARAQFSIWWYGIAIVSLLQGSQSLMASTAALPLGVVVGCLYLSLIVVCAALWGLVGYLTFLFTGRYYLLPLSVYYVALYVLVLFYFTLSDPIGIAIAYGHVTILYANTLPLAIGAIAVLLILLPELGGAVAYMALSSKTSDLTLRYRTRLVGGGILAWFLLSLVTGVATPVSSPIRLASPLLGVLAAGLVLIAYYPPLALRTRWGVRSVEEAPLTSGRSLVPPRSEGLWYPAEATFSDLADSAGHGPAVGGPP